MRRLRLLAPFFLGPVGCASEGGGGAVFLDRYRHSPGRSGAQSPCA